MDPLIPKSEWGPGPWQDEPDRLDWIDERTGLACVVGRNMLTGALCGYVGVPPSHPYFGWQYSDDIALKPGDLDDTTIDDVGVVDAFIYAMRGGSERGTIPLGMTLQAHQGVNWSGELPVGDTAGLWWFGFDCGHAWDFSPGLEATTRKAGEILCEMGVDLPSFLGRLPDQRYRDLDYVRKEVTALAFQLRQLETRVLIDQGVLKFMGAR